MKPIAVLAAAITLGGSIAHAGSTDIDALTECIHSSPDGRYTYSFLVNECPTIATVEMECAVFDNERKTVARNQRTYEPNMDARPRWNRRCVVLDENGKHVFTRGDKTFSVTRTADAAMPESARPVAVVEDAPCSQRAHTGRPRRLAARFPTPAWRW